MKLNTENNPLVKMYNGEATSSDGENYKVKLISFADPLMETTEHGAIRSGAFVEAPNGEIVARTFYADIFTDENLNKIGDYVVENIDAILRDWKLNPEQIHKLCINPPL